MFCNLFQNAGHSKAGNVWEVGSEVIHLAAVRVALGDVLLSPPEPRDLTTNVRASYIRRNRIGSLVGIVQANEGDSSLGSWIVQNLPEHARHWHLVSATNAQVQIHLVVVDIRQSGTTL